MDLHESDLPELPRDWLTPDWKQAGHVHDWRNYVPEALRARWLTLSRETRMVVACVAEVAADREQWD